MWPLFHVILLWVCRYEKVSMTFFSVLLMSIVGVFLGLWEYLISNELHHVTAIWCGLGSAVLIAIKTILIKRESASISAMETVFIYNAVGALALLPFCADILDISFPELTLGIGYGIGVGTLGFFWFFKAFQYISTSHISVLTYLEIPSGMLLAYLLFQEHVSISGILGGLLILSASIVLLKSETQKTLSV